MTMRATNPRYNDILRQTNSFRYQLLDRMRMDCDYWLGNGNRCDKHLWAGNVVDHCTLMYDLFNSFAYTEQPEWISLDDIRDYAISMGMVDAILQRLDTEKARDEIGEHLNEQPDCNGLDDFEVYSKQYAEDDAMIELDFELDVECEYHPANYIDCYCETPAHWTVEDFTVTPTAGRLNLFEREITLNASQLKQLGERL